MWSLPRRNHHRQYMTARNGDHATMCRSDWRSSRNVVQPALPKPQARAFVRRSKPSHRLTKTASSDPSSQTYPPSKCPLSMVDTISARYNASEHQHRTLTKEMVVVRFDDGAHQPQNEEPTMLNTTDKIIKHKTGLLNLARELGNVSKAGQSRSGTARRSPQDQGARPTPPRSAGQTCPPPPWSFLRH